MATPLLRGWPDRRNRRLTGAWWLGPVAGGRTGARWFPVRPVSAWRPGGGRRNVPAGRRIGFTIARRNFAPLWGHFLGPCGLSVLKVKRITRIAHLWTSLTALKFTPEATRGPPIGGGPSTAPQSARRRHKRNCLICRIRGSLPAPAETILRRADPLGPRLGQRHAERRSFRCPKCGLTPRAPTGTFLPTGPTGSHRAPAKAAGDRRTTAPPEPFPARTPPTRREESRPAPRRSVSAPPARTPGTTGRVGSHRAPAHSPAPGAKPPITRQPPVTAVRPPTE
ncbi:MAG: hypothetical protein JWL99_1923 [Streptomyces oryziradicis]|nr:hypothetical protein [Actinacidiphila oryziradicis]